MQTPFFQYNLNLLLTNLLSPIHPHHIIQPLLLQYNLHLENPHSIIIHPLSFFYGQSRFLNNWFSGQEITEFSLSLWYRQPVNAGQTFSPLVDNGECDQHASINLFAQGPATIGNLATTKDIRMIVAMMVRAS